jgi:hypothetical protein
MPSISAGHISPRAIRLEASSACQLRCPACPTGQMLTRTNACGTGFLKLRDFRQLLANNPAIKRIELSNWGEVFLNPDFAGILEHAWQRKIRLTILNGANLNHASDQALEALVKYRLRELVVALDGACNATYKQYRVNGNFERVIANVRKINRLKAQYHSDEPVLIWQFVLFGHNEHEIGQARRMAAELGMQFAPKLNVVPGYSPLVHPERALREAGLNPARANRNWQTAICTQLWKSPQINWNGKILGCCHNNWAEFGGNAFEGSLEKSLNGERLVYARKMLRGKAPPRDDIPCTGCDSYRQMASRGEWVDLARIRLDLLISRWSAVRQVYATYRRSGLRALLARGTIRRMLGWHGRSSGPTDAAVPQRR